MSRVQIDLKDKNRQKLEALSRQTGKSQDELVNQAVEELAAEIDENEERKFAEWREAAGRVAGIWADRDDLPDFDEIRRSMDRDVWGKDEK